MSQFTVGHQLVSLDINFDNRVVKGVTELTVDPKTASLTKIQLHCERPVVRSVSINGYICEFRRMAPDSRRKLLRKIVSQQHDSDLDRGNLEISIPPEVVIEAISDDIVTSGAESSLTTATAAGAAEVMYRSIKVRIEFYLVDPSSGILFTNTGDLMTVHTETQMYPSSTRLWVPCMDNIHERCTWDLFYTVPACLGSFDSGMLLPLTVVSVGELQSLVVHPKDPARRVFRYVMTTATPACTLGFVVGPFTSAYTLDGSLLANGAEMGDGKEPTNGAAGSEEEEKDTDKNKGAEDVLQEDAADDQADEVMQSLDADDTQQQQQHEDGDGVAEGQEPSSESAEAAEAAAAEEQMMAEAKASHNSKLRKATVDAIRGVFAFTYPGLQEELETTCSFIPEALAFHSQEFGSYPYATYKVVFMEGLRVPVVTCASLTLLSIDFLHPRAVIEPVYETRRCLGLAIAQQWFGTYIVAETWSDYWLVSGLAGYVAGLFVRHNLGHNEYRYRLKRDMTRLCHADVNQRPISYAEQGPIMRADDVEFVGLKAAVVLHMLDRRMMKGGMSLGLHRIVPKILVAAMSGDLGASNAVGTTWFLKMCRKVSGVDLKTFADQWIFGTGCPVFHFSYAFNRKKLAVEITMHQESTNSKATAPWAKPQLFSGQMTARIREADGTPYEHILDIHEATKRFEVQFNTKYKRIRRSTKRFHKRQIEAAEAELSVNVEVLGGDDEEAYSNIALFGAEDEDEKREWRVVEWGEDDEESLASATFEWIRMDPDLEWSSVIHFEQPDFMWAAQLQKDRDVAAQLEAVDALQHLPSSAASTTLMRTVMDGRVFYRVRVDAALALARFARPSLGWIGLHHLAKIYANRYCIENSASNELLPKPNNFANVGEYFTQKAVLAALSNVRDRHGEAPPRARALILAALRYNDNSENVYADCFFLASLVRALVGAAGSSTRFARKFSVCVDPQGDTAVLGEIERLRKLDMLVPSFHNVITCACLDAALRLSVVQPQEHLFNTALFLSMASPDAYVGVREVAIGGLLLHWGVGGDGMANLFFAALSSDSSAPRLANSVSRFTVEAMVLRAMAYGRQHNSLLFQEEAGKEATEHIDTDARLVGGLETFVDNVSDSPELQLLLAATMYDSAVPSRARELLAAVHALVYRTADCSLPPRVPVARKKLKIKLGARSQQRGVKSNASSDSEDTPLALGVDPYSADFILGEDGDRPIVDGVVNPGRRKWQRAPSFSEASVGGLPQIAGTRPPPITVPDTKMNSPAYLGLTGGLSSAVPQAPTTPAAVPATEPVKVKLKLKFSKASLASAVSTSVATPLSPHSTVPRVSSPLAAAHTASPPQHGRNISAGWSPDNVPPKPKPRPRPSISMSIGDAPANESPLQSPPLRSPESANPTVVSRPSLPPSTPPSSSLFSLSWMIKSLMRVLRKVSKHPSAFPFMRPVDVLLDGCPTYYDIIKKPMDLATIKRKLEGRKYSAPKEFEADMRLMLNNCYLFNPPGTPVYVMGQDVEAAFEDEWARAGLAPVDAPGANFAIPAGESRAVATNSAALEVSFAAPARESSADKAAAAAARKRKIEARSSVAAMPSERSNLSSGSSNGMSGGSGSGVSAAAAAHKRSKTHTYSAGDISAHSSSIPGTPSSKFGEKRSRDMAHSDTPNTPNRLSQLNSPPPPPSLSVSKSSGSFKLKLTNRGSAPLSQQSPLPPAPASTTAATFSSLDDPDAIMDYLDSTTLKAPTLAAPVFSAAPAPAPAPTPAPAPAVASSTPIPSGGNWKSVCYRVMLQLQALPCALEFMAPVDPIKQGVPTYFGIIKWPMDLGTVRKRLDRSQYRSPKQFVHDVKLVFDNCFLFNVPGTYVYAQGEALQKAFEHAWVQQTGTHPDDPPPAELPEDIALVDRCMERARSVLNKLKREESSWPFLKPVDPIAFGVPTYFDIIKNPMDLSTIQKKLAKKAYPSVADFVADIRLIIDDCFLFNPPDTPVHDCGVKMRNLAAKLLESDHWDRWLL